MTIRAISGGCLMLGLSLACSPLSALRPGVAVPAPVQRGTLAVRPEVVRALEAFAAERSRDLAQHGRAALERSVPADEHESVLAWYARVESLLRGPLGFEYETLHPSGDGVVAELRIPTGPLSSGSGGLYQSQVFLGPSSPGSTVWAVQSEDGDRGGAVPLLLSESARIQVFPRSEWLVAEVRARVRTQGAVLLAFAFDAHRSAPPGGFRITELSQNGQPCRYASARGKLIVELARPAAEAELVFRYEGAPSSGGDFVTARDLVLRKEAGWLPTLPGSTTAFSVDVRSAEAFEFFGQGERVASDARRSRWKFSGDAFTLYGAPEYAKREFSIAGTSVTLALWPKSAARLDALQSTVRAAFAGLAPLGDYPYPQLRIVESDFPGGYGALSNITIGSSSVQEPSLEFFAHEIAHGWFSGVALQSPRTGAWNEALAEYVSSWALSGEQADRQRLDWASDYAGLSPAQDVLPIPEVTSRSRRAVHRAVSYAKAPLLLHALEQRIGRSGMIQALSRFLRTRKGLDSSWSDVAEAVEQTAGAQQGAWLRSWLARPGAPDLKLSGVTTRDGRLRARLTQSSEPPFAGDVELVFLAGDTELGTHTAAFSASQTAIDLPIPAGATRLRLDPHRRLPRRFDAERPELEQGLEIPLPGARAPSAERPE